MANIIQNAKATGSGSASTATVSLTGTTAGNSLIFIVCAPSESGAITCSDASMVLAAYFTNANSDAIYVWYRNNIPGGSYSVYATPAAYFNATEAVLYETVPLATSGTVAASGSFNFTPTQGTGDVFAGTIPTQTFETLDFYALAQGTSAYSNATATLTPSNWTMQASGLNAASTDNYYYVASADTAANVAINPTVTANSWSGGTNTLAGLTVAFKLAGGGSSGQALTGSLVGNAVLAAAIKQSLSLNGTLIGTSILGSTSFKLLVQLLSQSVNNGALSGSLFQKVGLVSTSTNTSLNSASLTQTALIASQIVGSGYLGASLQELLSLLSTSQGQSALSAGTLFQSANLHAALNGASVESVSTLYQLLQLSASSSGSSLTAASLAQLIHLISSAIGSGNVSSALSQALSLVSGLSGSAQLEAATLVFGFFLYSATTGSSALSVSALQQALSLVAQQQGVGSLASTLRNLFFVTSASTGQSTLSATADFVLSLLSSTVGTAALFGTLFQNAKLTSDALGAALLGAAIAQQANLQSQLKGIASESSSLDQTLKMIGNAYGTSQELASELIQLARLNASLNGYASLSASASFGVALQLLAAATGSSNLLVTKLSQAFLLGQTKATGVSLSVASLAQNLAVASSSNGSATLQGMLEKLLELSSSSTGSSHVEVTLELLSSILTNFPVYYVVSLPNNEVWIITADPYKDMVADAPKNIPNVISFIQ